MWRVNSVMITIIKNRTKCTILLPYNKKTVFLHIGNNKHIWAKTFFSQYETYMKGFAKGNEKGFFVSLPQITLKPYRYGDTEERSLL